MRIRALLFMLLLFFLLFLLLLLRLFHANIQVINFLQPRGRTAGGGVEKKLQEFGIDMPCHSSSSSTKSNFPICNVGVFHVPLMLFFSLFFVFLVHHTLTHHRYWQSRNVVMFWIFFYFFVVVAGWQIAQISSAQLCLWLLFSEFISCNLLRQFLFGVFFLWWDFSLLLLAACFIFLQYLLWSLPALIKIINRQLQRQAAVAENEYWI